MTMKNSATVSELVNNLRELQKESESISKQLKKLMTKQERKNQRINGIRNCLVKQMKLAFEQMTDQKYKVVYYANYDLTAFSVYTKKDNKSVDVILSGCDVKDVCEHRVYAHLIEEEFRHCIYELRLKPLGELTLTDI